jgi:hypothetical protein
MESCKDCGTQFCAAHGGFTPDEPTDDDAAFLAEAEADNARNAYRE